MAPLPEAYYGKRRYDRPKARQGRMSHHAEKLQTWYVGAPLVTPARRNGVTKTVALPKARAVASVPPVASPFWATGVTDGATTAPMFRTGHTINIT